MKTDFNLFEKADIRADEYLIEGIEDGWIQADRENLIEYQQAKERMRWVKFIQDLIVYSKDTNTYSNSNINKCAEFKILHNQGEKE